MMMRFLALLVLVVATASAEQEVGNANINKHTKGLGFFTHFGSKFNRNKVPRDVLECDYDHPEKSGYCPPIGNKLPYSITSKTDGEL